ncbi:MAG: hypothetical protein LAN18_01105 [Acidobacteriia bacterium]|nr:hypothetical protein [Terriglobia bacterium]
MSSGTQIELDVLGSDGGQGVAATAPASGANGAGPRPGVYPTDEEILGMEPAGAITPARRDVIPSARTEASHRGDARNLSSIDDAGNAGTQRDSSGKDSPRNDNLQTNAAMPEWMQSLAGDPQHGAEAQQLWQEHQAFRAAFSSPDEARAIKELFPGGAQEARTLRQAAQAVDQLDAAIYSGDARAQSEVVAELARANPAAFRQLFAEAAKVLAGMGQANAQRDSSGQPPALGMTAQLPTMHGVIPSEARNLSSIDDRATSGARRDSSSSLNNGSPRNDNGDVNASQQTPQFDPAAYAAFERSTNDVVARDVRAAVSDTLTRVLPEGVAEGAARRIGDDIFNEIHRTLAADRTLSEQVGDVLRDRRFGAAEQQRVASLLAGRAKQLVPGVARRVIGEWTSSVLGTARTKAARQAAAAARVDIAAPGGSLDSMPLRPMSAREIDYASMSDDEILGM